MQFRDYGVYQPPVSSLSDEEVAQMLEFEALCEQEYQFCCNLAAFFEAVGKIASSPKTVICRSIKTGLMHGSGFYYYHAPCFQQERPSHLIWPDEQVRAIPLAEVGGLCWCCACEKEIGQ